MMENHNPPIGRSRRRQDAYDHARYMRPDIKNIIKKASELRSLETTWEVYMVRCDLEPLSAFGSWLLNAFTYIHALGDPMTSLNNLKFTFDSEVRTSPTKISR